MTEKKNIVIGPQLKEVKLLSNNILVRLIDVPYEEGIVKILGASKSDESKIRKIDRFHGFHPQIVEVVAVSEEAGKSGVSVGDIVSITNSAANDIRAGYVELVYIDSETVVRMTIESVSAIMNYYREYVKEGKIIKNIR